METFIAVYANVRYAEGETLLKRVVTAATVRPLQIEDGIGKKMLHLLSLAYHLQIVQGEDKAIHLPVEVLASHIGCSPTFVSRLLANARTAGYIEMVDGCYSMARGKAKAYRFNLASLKSTDLPKAA